MSHAGGPQLSALRLRLSDNYKYLAEGPMLAYVSPHWSEAAPDSGREIQLLVDDVICLSADEDALDVALMVELGYANAVPVPVSLPDNSSLISAILFWLYMYAPVALMFG